MNMKIEDYPWFCPEPFTNTMTAVGGLTKPCCVIDTKSWSGQSLDDFRKEFLGQPGELIEKCCAKCIHQERIGAKSQRQVSLENFSEGNKFGHKKKQLEENLDNPPLLTMEWKAQDNLCNLKCNMCKPILSSTLAKENIALEKSIHPKMSGARYKGKNVFPDLSNIVELKLVGGETLAIAENYEIMEMCPPDVTLKITTNGTVTPKFDGKTIFNYIPKFKKVEINVSIEFWGERNNYLRFPSKWERIMKNVMKFKSFKNCAVSYHCTLNALNVGYMLEILDNADCPAVLGNLVWGKDEIYSIKSVPLSIREQYISKYYNDYRDETDKFISYLEDTEYDEVQMWKMIQDIKDRDKYRGTCLVDVFPEWEPYYV